MTAHKVIRVIEVLDKDYPILPANGRLPEIIEAFSRTAHTMLPVFGAFDAYYGVLPLRNLLEALFPSYFSLLPSLEAFSDFGLIEQEIFKLETQLFIAEDLIDDDIVPLVPDESVVKAVIQLIKLKYFELPVVSKGKFEGFVTLKSITEYILKLNR